MLRRSLPPVVLILTLTACATVEGSGRSQLKLMPESTMNSQGAAAFAQIKQDEKPCTDQATVVWVTRLGQRLAAAQPTVTSDRKFVYEFTVLESESVNAFCLPGGKVAVYTGILPYAENEAGLAAVLGHEIAHATCDHGNERVSQNMVTGFGQSALAVGLQQAGYQQDTSTMILAAAGGLTQVGILLPYSRSHETEADVVGLKYMAAAGYDPREAVKFWQRFATLGSGGPSFMSTHPNSEDRAANLAKLMPEALALYEKAPVKYGVGEAVPAKYRK